MCLSMYLPVAQKAVTFTKQGFKNMKIMVFYPKTL